MTGAPFNLACSAQLHYSQAAPCSVRLSFPEGAPSDIDAVRLACDEALSSEAQARRLPPFRTALLRVYDYNLHQWLDLQHIAQLVNGGQVHADGVDAEDMHSPPGGKQGMGQPTPWGERPHVSREHKLQATFAGIAGDTGAVFTCAQLDRRFRGVDIDFTVETVQELFERADRNGNGSVSFAEWCEWGRVFPNTLDCLFHRASDRSDEARLRDGLTAAHEELRKQEVLTQPMADELAALRAREQSLRDELAMNARHQGELERRLIQAGGEGVQVLRERVAVHERDLREVTARRDKFDGQERELMEQE
eukprot:Hpha_TRINITY_DN23029_c0_g1::TRINITY_DN23029_c0_g1_i1::g.109313::m.109313